jgi:excisionase family DNA binding protein
MQKVTSYVNLSEASRRTGVDRGTLSVWLKNHKIKGYMVGGRSYRIDPKSLESLFVSY